MLTVPIFKPLTLINSLASLAVIKSVTDAKFVKSKDTPNFITFLRSPTEIRVSSNKSEFK